MSFLVCMRLKDMRRVHPQQDNSRRCSKCDWPVGIYPTGQKALKADPGLAILCQVCGLRDRRLGDEDRPAGPWEDIFEEMRSSKEARR